MGMELTVATVGGDIDRYTQFFFFFQMYQRYVPSLSVSVAGGGAIIC